jgi:DNA mismatch endonuclease, patch repair protein
VLQFDSENIEPNSPMGLDKIHKLWREVPRRPYKARHSAITSKMMAAVRYRDNRAEAMLRRELWNRGFRYRLHVKNLPGKPDIVFPSRRVAVFVDGDFWHGRGILQDGLVAFRQTMRGPNSDWWITKLERTIARDREVNRLLAISGWKVIRVWESLVLANAGSVSAKITRQLQRRALSGTSKRMTGKK